MVVTKKLEEVRRQRNKADIAKLRNIVDMSLAFTAMIRIFEKGSKNKLKEKIVNDHDRFFNAVSEDEFKAIHTGFCVWGMENIKLAKKKLKNGGFKKSRPASYGQIAKTLDVVLHVVVFYGQYPNAERATMISKWLNAAMDTKMMSFLAGCYPNALAKWPKTIEEVDQDDYSTIQDIVRLFIQEEHQRCIIPVNFDDMYWEVLNQ
jgi:hypothetical protein